MESTISNSESVVRILKKDWFDDGKLMHVAFALRKGETYISVNRPSVDSFENDIRNFVNAHQDYAFGDDTQEYCGASLIVGDIRDIHIVLDDESIDVDVDVEPRDIHVKSHAGIFTRYNDVNLKPGDHLDVDSEKIDVSTDDILLKTRLQLVRKARCQWVRIKSE
jgi:hypothetical protein